MVKSFWMLMIQETTGVAIASAGPYANYLDLAPNR